ncbi:Bile acid:sodium symporter [Stanieria cyanosphaera PCC 7437]|uniref:Bile acid:sodium symporter n=1 Tax=Stanieria cyanosphaera (strain ATCC 29371 / PCC 7437) TaxID=111780 RepID=K9XYF8_STAC7|nr:bile acid:sodium symporter [Stanieria cyanosphaera]AFZ37161.1 Bile acid:sodium symporter [Stanieria cyanosphaera PCC 7437]
MPLFEKVQPFLVLLSVFVGLALAQIGWVANIAPKIIVPLLALMLYATFLPIPLKGLGRGLRNFKVTSTSLIINFFWTPIFTWINGYLFLSDSPDLRVGLIMLMVTPCTDWYLVFTGVARGDVALATALLPLNLVLQVILLPVYLLIFAGTLVEINLMELFESLFWVLFLPLLVATISRQFILRWQGVVAKMAIFQVICLNLAIATIFASQGKVVIQHPEFIFQLFIPVVLFFVVNFVLGQVIGRYLKFSYPEVACLSCTTLARNSPLSIAIAASAFPHRPLIALVLVIGPLIELPVMVLISQLLLLMRRRGQWQQ